MQTVNNNKPEQINSALFAISDDITKQNIQTKNAIKSSEAGLQKQIDKLTDSLKNNGGLITGGTYNINISGNASTATNAATATSADKATKDSAGNTIATTYAKKTEVPTKTSQLTNDSSFVTSGQLAKVATSGKYSDLSGTPTIPTDTNQLTNGAGYITSSGSITGNAATATKATKVANALTINGKTYDGSSAVDAGVQTVANGGTGVTTQEDINKAFVGGLEEGLSDVTDGTMFVSSYASDNGFADTNAANVPYKRKFSRVWEYIKGKISSVLGLSTDGLSSKGNITAPDNKYIRAICASNDYVQIMGSGTSDSGSGEISTGDNGVEPLYARQRDTSNNVTHEITLLDASGNQKFNTVTANGFIGNLSGKANTAGTADKVASAGDSGRWIQGRAYAIVKTTTAASNDGWKAFASIKTASGSYEIGNLSGEDFIRLAYSSDANVNSGTNDVTHIARIGYNGVGFFPKVDATYAGIRIPTSQPSTVSPGDIWIE